MKGPLPTVPAAWVGSKPEALFRQIVEKDCYGVMHLRRAPKWFIDIGANSGVFSYACAKRYPESIVIACEPDPDTHQQLQANLRDLNNVVALKQGLGKADQGYELVAGPTSLRTQFRPTDAGQAFDLRPLHQLATDNGVQAAQCFVKIDCEGGESLLLDEPLDRAWLARSLGFGIEVHAFDYLGVGFQERFLDMARHTWRKSHQLTIEKVGARNRMLMANKRAWWRSLFR